MSSKWHLRLGILLILFIFGVYIRVHEKRTSYIKRHALLNIPDSTHIVGFSIIKDTDTIVLKRENDKWVIELENKRLPANINKVEELASKFVNAEYQIAGLTTKDMEVYGINDTTSTKIVIKTDKGKTKTLIMGKRGPIYNSFYFVFPDRKRVYLLFGMPPYSISTKIEDYRDKKVVNIKLDDIKEFTLISGKDTLRIERVNDSFRAYPEKDTLTIHSVLNRSRVLTAFGFAEDLPDSITGVLSSNKKVIFITHEDDTVLITVGNKGENALFVLSNKRPGEVFKVYRSWFDEVLKKAGILTNSKS